MPYGLVFSLLGFFPLDGWGSQTSQVVSAPRASEEGKAPSHAAISDAKRQAPSPPPESSSPPWFGKGPRVSLGAVLLFAGIFFFCAFRAKKGKFRGIRPIDGLVVAKDAIGRAAEMGRPILFVPGLQTASDPSTVAAMAIFSEVVKGAAALGTRVMAPIYSPLTWPVAQNVMREAYLEVGKPDDYDSRDVMYLTSRSFTFAASVMGRMAREKPAANFFMGHFYSESLLLAETGAGVGAMQIAGTDSEVQLPFFITTCDYTLIGEELYAAAAEISRDPLSHSTIAAHDIFKLVLMLFLTTGFVLLFLDALGVAGARECAHILADFLAEASQ